MERPRGIPITETDWDQTSPTVQELVGLVWQENLLLKEHLAEMKRGFEKQVAFLQEEVEKLQEQVNKNSHNSSKPPSSDGPQQRNYPKLEPSGEKKGVRKGHHGHGRKLKTAQEVNEIVKSVPTVCEECGALLLGEDPQQERHQFSEVSKIKSTVVEYQRHSLDCLVCGHTQPGRMASGNAQGKLWGALASLDWLFGGSFWSQPARHGGTAGDPSVTVFQVNISLGSIPAQERRVSRALKQLVVAALSYVQAPKAVNMDESS